MSQNGALSTNQRRALASLLGSTSVEGAARDCGLSSRTIWRYLSEPVFGSELSRRELGIIEHAARVLAAEAEATIAALVELRDDKSLSPSVRHRACATLLSAALDYRGLALERRISELEVRVFGGNTE